MKGNQKNVNGRGNRRTRSHRERVFGEKNSLVEFREGKKKKGGIVGRQGVRRSRETRQREVQHSLDMKRRGDTSASEPGDMKLTEKNF